MSSQNCQNMLKPKVMVKNPTQLLFQSILTRTILMLSNATNQPKSPVELGYMCPQGLSGPQASSWNKKKKTNSIQKLEYLLVHTFWYYWPYAHFGYWTLISDPWPKKKFQKLERDVKKKNATTCWSEKGWWNNVSYFFRGNIGLTITNFL